jgi:hypothetical protein
MKTPVSLIALAASLGATLAAIAVPAAFPAGAATLAGRVLTQPNGRPTAGVWVRVRRSGDVLTMQPRSRTEPASFMALSDVRGNFRLERVPVGLYEASVCRESLSTALAPEAPARAVIVSRNDRAEVVLNVTRLATVEGRVWKQGAAPARGGRVRAYRRTESAPFADCLVDHDGRFRILNAEPGVELKLIAYTNDGIWQRASVRPLRPGPWPFDFTVPTLAGLPRRPVQIAVLLPFAQDRPLELVWRSEPPEQMTGYESIVPLDREGRCEFLSPTGIFRAEVREIAGDRRVWKAPRLYRVEAEAKQPLQAVVPLEVAAPQH